MFKRLMFLTAVIALTIGGVGGSAFAQTPSTNDLNRTNGWAHVDQLVKAEGSTELQFISTRGFASCFEYRTDGDTGQVLAENGGKNYNDLITDGLYPYVCVSNSSKTQTITAQNYVEVRMVFGAEADERFTWTRFDVIPAPRCKETGFFRDGINMTAALINPGDRAGTISAPYVVDATGCNIGVYFSASGSIQYADIYGANYFGVVVNGDAALINVDIKDSAIHNIGEPSFNGSQHGVAIYYRAYGAESGVTGDIDGNTITLYQKGGITVNGPTARVNTLGNIVTGLGQVNFIAQNGVQYWESNGTVRGNAISGNFYTGTVGVGPNPGGQNPPGWEYVSGGLLLYQAGLVKHSKNFYADNQRNVFMVQ